MRTATDRALEEILVDLRPRFRATLARFRVPAQDADDLLQQTLVVYLCKEDQIEDPESWLLGTLRNHCRQYWTASRRKLYTAVDAALLEALVPTRKVEREAADLRHDLNLALGQISNRCRDILRLRYQQGYRAPEAARRLGYRPSSIYKLTQRCLAALGKCLIGPPRLENSADA